MKPEEKQPVPIRSVTLQEGGLSGDGGVGGSGGGDPKEEVNDERPQDPVRHLPEPELKREMIAASTWVPDLKDSPEALKTLVESPNYKKLDALNDDLKKRLARGFGNATGKGNEEGKGASGDAGKGSGAPTDAASSGNRSNRWIITFKTSSGPDYLKQLAAFEAKLVIPEPPTFSRNRLFDDISTPNPGKLLADNDSLPAMCFVDDNKASAARVAKSLGLDYEPPRFIAFFPKKIEDELAAKERAFRNRKEDQIHSTTFNVIERDGKYEIRVTDQVAVRK